MERKYIYAMIALAVPILSFSLVASPDKVWLETRIFGLVSFFALFLTVVLGELRMITLIKGQFRLFRFHKPLGIFALSTVGFHFITAILDRSRWGAGLLAYFGFGFSDNWLIFLSFGALAFYLMIVVAVTSARAARVKLGFKYWKLIHYLSYASFIIAYIHAINLGTDLRHSAAMFILKPVLIGSLLIVISLAFTRAVLAIIRIQDQMVVYMSALAFLIVLFGSVILVMVDSQQNTESKAVANSIGVETQKIASQEDTIVLLKNETGSLKNELGVLT